MEIWDSMEAIEEESTKRKILNAKAKSKKYEKKMAGQYVMSWRIDSQLASFISVFMAKYTDWSFLFTTAYVYVCDVIRDIIFS